MREIKFRAWSKFENKMYPVEQWQNRSWIAVPIPTDNGNGDVDWHLEQRLLEDVELMQFTGLTDKNGVEIYEGDILGGYPHGTVAVTWNDKYTCLESKPLDGGDQALFGNDFDDCKDQWEVIGNIYENPELLAK